MNKNEILKEVYYNVDTGLSGKTNLYKYIQEHFKNSGITYKDINDFLKKQEGQQILTKIKHKDLNFNSSIKLKLGEIQWFNWL